MSRIRSVAIIGGGVSGLAAGALLSTRGLQVKLFEAGPGIGGSCGATEIGGYRFNDGAIFLAFPGLLNLLFDRVGIDRLPLRKITAPQTTWLPDGSVVTFGDGLDVTVRRPSGGPSQERLQSDLNRMMERWEPVLRLFADEILPHPFSLARLIRKGWRHLPRLRGTVAAELERLFQDDAVRAAMAGTLLFTGLPPQRAPVQLLLGLVAMFSEGYYLPEGGMARIPEALARAMVQRGGEILPSSRVQKIIVRSGQVRGLEVAGIGSIEADAVISTASGMVTFGSLLDPEEVPAALRRRVDRAPLSMKAMSVQLGLANRIEVPSYANSILPMMDRQAELLQPSGPDVRWLNYYVPTLPMPELAPPGTSIVELFASIPQDLPVEHWDEAARDRAAQAAVEALGQQHRLEIRVIRTRGPKEFQEGMHLYRGAIYGLSPAADPFAQFPHQSPVRGLYQAGQTTYPGFGVAPAAMSGIFAAQRVLQAGGALPHADRV